MAGSTWSPPVNLAPTLKGNTSATSFVVDSAGTLHLLFGGLGWTARACATAAGRTGPDAARARLGDLPQSEGGVAAITGGNTIHAVWVDLQQDVVYHAEMNTGSPVVAPDPIRIATVAPEATATPLSERPLTPATNPAMPPDPAGVQSERRSGYLIALIALPPAIVVAVAALVAARRRR